MTFIGFDFGTTNSLVAQIQALRPVVLLDEEGLPTPSVACYEGEQKILGRDAKKRISEAGLGVQGNIIKSPKLYLKEESVFVGGVSKSPTEVVSDIVEHTLKEADNSYRRLKNIRGDSDQYDFKNISGAVVTIPVDMPGYARQALRDSFRRAGLRIYQFIHEPFAALYGYFRKYGISTMVRRYQDKKILVVDWGGGTLDLTLCTVTKNMLLQLKNDGSDDVGGDMFDEAIMNYVQQKTTKNRGIISPTHSLGAKARLFYECERAKIDLSTRSTAQIYVPEFFRNLDDNDFECSISGEELESIIAPLLDKAFNRITNLLELAGYSTEQVTACLMIGGMANMPAIKSRIHELFGPVRVIIPENTATLVAEGAAWVANDRNGLSLAKTVELEQARGSFLPLIKAGAEMPKEGKTNLTTFNLYCTDTRDGVAKFQICTPLRAGVVLFNEPRRALADMTVKIDSRAQAFRERLQLNIEINDNLILKMKAISTNENDVDSCEIHELEFGLNFPSSEVEQYYSEDVLTKREVMQNEQISCNSVRVRSNVADNIDNKLVPGEFLYSYNPQYFDVRSSPPQEQVEEKLYYSPCAQCGRRSNDPECTCALRTKK